VLAQPRLVPARAAALGVHLVALPLPLELLLLQLAVHVVEGAAPPLVLLARRRELRSRMDAGDAALSGERRASGLGESIQQLQSRREAKAGCQ